MKFALISHVLPPSASGQAVVLYRLLRGLPAERYCLLSPTDYTHGGDREQAAEKLPGAYYQLPAPRQLTRGYRPGLATLRRGLNYLLGYPSLRQQSTAIAEIARAEGCTALVPCTGNLWLLPAAFAAGRQLDIPVYPYIFDYYSYQWTGLLEHRFAQRQESRILRGAAGVIVPNETLADELSARYGITPTVLHNPCEVDAYQGASVPLEAGRDGEYRVVYTGTVYEAQADAFCNLLAAIARLPHRKIMLHLYTSSPARYLDSLGISGPVVCHPHQAAAAMVDIQRRADLLFLPLAFTSTYHPAIIRTAAPGKLGEYLAARRPILVHAPADSFPTRYFRQHRCGIVVDQRDPVLLADALERALTDATIRRTVADNAWTRAQHDFDLPVVRAQFARLLDFSDVLP